MRLEKLRAYVATDRDTTGRLPVLVLDDGDERIIIRTDGKADWLKIGADRLMAGALELVSVVAAVQVSP